MTINKLVVNAPLNNLSFGNVSYNILRELWKEKMDTVFFPSAQPDVGAFDQIDGEFREWLNNSISSRLKDVKREYPTFRLWHLKGSTDRITPNQFLYTFYELNEPTEEEVAAVNLQDHVFVSSNYTRDTFILAGVDPSKISYVPLGVDEEVVKTDGLKIEGKINFSLMGKWEKRKHTAKILKLWADNFGDDMQYQLNCLISNPFMKKEALEALIAEALGGKSYFNINFIPHLETNSQVNQLMNRMDIDLTGLSGAEGWNLPAFNSAALGNQVVVLNATAHKDWAEDAGAIIVEPNGKETSVDGIFFHPNQPFNQGEIYTWDEKDALAGINKAVENVRAGKENEKGLKLREKYSYKKTLMQILEVISQNGRSYR